MTVQHLRRIGQVGGLFALLTRRVLKKIVYKAPLRRLELVL